MSEFIEKNNKIVINGESFSLTTFKILEPDYEEVGYRVYIPEECPPGLHVPKHHIIQNNIQSSGPIPWKDGDRYINQSSNLKYLEEQLDLDERERIKEVESTISDQLPYNEKRKSEYPPIEDLIIALWENEVESNPTKLLKLQEKREEIKKRHPKT